MDSIKPYLDILKKHYFWIVSFIVLLIALFTFSSVSGNLDEKRAETEGKVEAEFKQAKAITTQGDKLPEGVYHPNEETHVGMIEKTHEAKRNLRKAWKMRFDEQKPLLTWDEEIGSGSIEQFNSLPLPIEKHLEFTELAEAKEDLVIDVASRIAYQRLIIHALPKLAEEIGDAWQPILKRPLTEKGIREKQEKVRNAKRIVVWDSDNQAYWEKKFTQFTNDINQQSYPRTLQVMYAQEDKWILTSILKDIIKKTNGDAIANDLAKIKKIDHIYIGRDAQGIVGEVELAKDPKAMNEAQGSGDGEDIASQEAEMMAEMMAAMQGGGSGSSSSASSSGTKAKTYGDGTKDPANGRYVDLNFEPLSAKTLRDTFKAVKKDQAYLAIAKRIPVRIGMVMDERAIMELLANCANARLPLEVKQVRINAHEAGKRGSLASKFPSLTSGPTTAGGGTSGGTRSAEDEMMQQMMMAEEGTGPGGPVKDEAVTVGSAYDTNVEIFGVIYLYNPPDDAILDVPEDAPEDPADQTASSDSEGVIRRTDG